jgi:hypothetical protein
MGRFFLAKVLPYYGSFSFGRDKGGRVSKQPQNGRSNLGLAKIWQISPAILWAVEFSTGAQFVITTVAARP